MAINKAIVKPPKSHAGMKKCLAYVMRADKTEESLIAVTGPFPGKELNAKNVYQAFLQEKQIWNKDSGRMCYHNVISWHKDEEITPEEAFAFGLEFADHWFAGYQTVIAVHKDRDHIHCHMVTNSVSYENGRKYHSSKKDLEAMKQMTNRMCRNRGLTVTQKGKHFDDTPMEEGTVTAWSQDKYKLFQNENGKSYVWDCAVAVTNAMRNCFSRETFMERMKEAGWNVHWKDTRKHLTFENEEGRKVRDSNLEKTFHLPAGKEDLEHEFIRQREEAGADDGFEQYYRQLEELMGGDDTETQRILVSESGTLRGQSEAARRTAEGINRIVRDDEAQSRTEQRERSAKEQRRPDAERTAEKTSKRNRRRSGPEL